jgi:hypothetical protein
VVWKDAMSYDAQNADSSVGLFLAQREELPGLRCFRGVRRVGHSSLSHPI